MTTETMQQKIYDRAYELAKRENKGHVMYNFLLAYSRFLADSTIAKIVDKAYFDENNDGLKVIYCR